jgi:hypothetical protein
MKKKEFRMTLLTKTRLFCCLIFPVCLSCGNSQSRGIRFTGGKYEFLSVDESPAGANRARLSLADYNGGKAVRAELNGNGIPYIVIDASSILGKSVASLREMQVTIGVENPSGEFYAVSGDIRAYSGADRTESRDPWSVYLPNKNPNIARAVLDEGEEFIPGAYNFFILTRKEDVALGEGKPPSHLVISEIHFFDVNGKEMRVNPDAGFSAPEGFGELDRSNLLPVSDEIFIEKSDGTSKNWGQAVALDTAKNGGSFDASLLGPRAVITVYYASGSPPELILQSWTQGAPEGSGWAKTAPAAVNNSASAAQYTYAGMAAAFGTEDFAPWLDKLYVGDTGGDLTVYAVTVGALSRSGE